MWLEFRGVTASPDFASFDGCLLSISSFVIVVTILSDQNGSFLLSLLYSVSMVKSSHCIGPSVVDGGDRGHKQATIMKRMGITSHKLYSALLRDSGLKRRRDRRPPPPKLDLRLLQILESGH